MSHLAPSFDDIWAAAARISGHVHRTPVLRSSRLDALAGAELYFKCENLQKVGAFKARGALNGDLSLDDDAAARGVATHSSGNHGAALAWAAGLRGIPARVVMPTTAPKVKQVAVASYGATVVPCEPTLAAREATVATVVADSGATLVHPYDDPRVIAGQGTAVLELLAEVPDLDLVVVPVGGGGLLSGTAVACRGVAPRTRILGAEPAGADDAAGALAAGRPLPQTDPQTIADGLRTALSERTFALIERHVDDIVTVSEEAIVAAMRLVFTYLKLVVEPSAAVPLAAVLDGGQRQRSTRIGVILSGGNVDLDQLPW